MRLRHRPREALLDVGHLALAVLEGGDPGVRAVGRRGGGDRSGHGHRSRRGLDLGGGRGARGGDHPAGGGGRGERVTVDSVLHGDVLLARGERGELRTVAGGRRVGLPVVGTVDLHRHLRCGSGQGVRIALDPERLEADGQPERGRAAERREERVYTRTALLVHRKRLVRAIPEDPRDEPGEDAAGADLDEGADAGGVHGLDLLDEAHRLGEVRAEGLREAVRGESSRGGVRPHGHVRRREGHAAEVLREGLGRGGDERRVEGGRDGELRGAEAGGLAARHHGFDAGDRAGHDGLLGGVQVGDDDAVDEERRHVGGRAGDRGHRAGDLARVRHEHAAGARGRHPVGVGHRACRPERGELAEAVAGGGVGLEAAGAEEVHHRGAGRADRWLGPLGAHDRRLVTGAILLGEGRAREQHVREAGDGGLGVVVGGARHVEAHREVLAHVDVLAPLAGEHERDLARVEAGVEVDVRAVDGLPVAHRRDRAVEDGIDRLLDDERDAERLRGVERLLAVVGELEEGLAARGLEEGDEALRRVRREDEELGRREVRAERAAGGADVLLAGHVEVRAAEAERADARAPGVRLAVDPRPRLGVHVERAVREVRGGRGLRDLDRGREHLVVQGHHHLEEPGGARGGLGVADLGLDGPEGAPLAVLAARLLEDHLEALDLGGVAGLGRGAVGLDEVDRVGAVARHVVALAQGAGLALGDRRVHRLGLAVRGGAEALDDGVDLVPVALGVGEALERHHAEALAEERAVTGLVEGAAVARGRERRRLAEAHVHEDVVQRVHAAGHHHVALAEAELVDREVHGGERAGAGGVRDAVRAAEVQAVRDAAGDDVAEEAREGALLPTDVVAGDAIAGLLHVGLAHAHAAQRALPHGALEPAHERAQQLLGAGDAEDDGDAARVEGLGLEAGHVVQHGARDDEREELGGVGRREDGGRDAKTHRVERDVVQEGAALGVGLVRRLRIGVVVVLDQPVPGGDLADEILLLQDVLPEAGDVLGAGEQGAGADDGDGGEGGFRGHRLRPPREGFVG